MYASPPKSWVSTGTVSRSIGAGGGRKRRGDRGRPSSASPRRLGSERSIWRASPAQRRRGALSLRARSPAFRFKRSARPERRVGVFGIGAAARDGLAAGREAARLAGFPTDADFPLPEDDPPALALDAAVGSQGTRQELRGPSARRPRRMTIRLAHREGFSHIEHAKRLHDPQYGDRPGQDRRPRRRGDSGGGARRERPRRSDCRPSGPIRCLSPSAPSLGGPRATASSPFDAPPYTTGTSATARSCSVARGTDAPVLLPKGRREDAWTAICARRAWCARRWRLRRLDARQDRPAGTRRRRLPRPPVCQHDVHAACRPRALRADAGVRMGIVFDDGTVTRLGPEHFLVTTTTGEVEAVLEHMEFHAQTVWPELDLQFCSVTHEWAQMSVAGPRKSRHADESRGPRPVECVFPFVAAGEATIADVPARLFRISFSGELALRGCRTLGLCRADLGGHLSAGREFGIAAHGLEAMGVLRIEQAIRRDRSLWIRDRRRSRPRAVGEEERTLAGRILGGTACAHRSAPPSPDRNSARGQGAALRGGAHLAPSRGRLIAWAT